MDIRTVVDAIGLGVDVVGVFVIVAAIAIAAFGFARGLRRRDPFDSLYLSLRRSIGRGILLGLELLVAGDIIRTVVVAPTFTSVGVLALIVAIRTFLSFRWKSSSPDAGRGSRRKDLLRATQRALGNVPNSTHRRAIVRSPA